MSRVRDLVWLLPFIGSILSGISLFTPAFVDLHGVTPVLYYMTGFRISMGGIFGPSFGFIGIPFLIIIGVICLILVIVCTIIMFISSLTHRKKDIPGSWLALGIILMFEAIYYISGTQLGFMIYRAIRGSAPLNFWGYYVPSFATIAPFITSGLSILAFIVGKVTTTEEVEIKPISKEAPPVSMEASPVSQPVSKPIPAVDSQAVKFCPACGEKIPNPQAQYCPSCGYDLKKEE